MEEKFSQNTKYGSSSKNEDEEDCVLDAKAKKRKGKKFHSKSESSKDGKKRDMSRVKCFHCHEHGHYATHCPQKKKNKKALGSTDGEALTS